MMRDKLVKHNFNQLYIVRNKYYNIKKYNDMMHNEIVQSDIIQSSTTYQNNPISHITFSMNNIPIFL